MDAVKEKFPSVFDFILSEEADFRTRKLPLATNWDWNMYDHIDKHFQLKNSQFTMGSNDQSSNPRPFKNILLPILNVAYRSEGFDVKDIEAYVDDPDYFHLSLFARKFHNRWARKYHIDTAIDESVESYTDYGLTLVKNVNEQRPEVIDLKSELAFCNQANILGGAICLKHDYSIDELMDMKGKWYSDEIEQAIMASTFTTTDENNKSVQNPSKSIPVYELHGVFPKSWLKDDEGEEDNSGKYVRQMHIFTYITGSKDGSKNGICLYKGPIKQIFKALRRDDNSLKNRACGRGGIEELFHPQIWTNYSELQIKEILDATATMVLKTTDRALANRMKTTNLKKNEIIYLAEGKDINQLLIQPYNKVAFDEKINAWEQNARVTGSASDPQLGLNPTSGTPLGTTQIVTQQGQGIHEYRRGKISVFWEEIYREWVLTAFTKELSQGDQWLEDLDSDELQSIANVVSVNESNKIVKDSILSGVVVTKEDRDTLIQQIRQEFLKKGTKHFLEVMKGEFAKMPLHVFFNIAGKQENLVDRVNKLNNVFRTVFANPAILQAPGMGDLFNQILELSGLSPIDLGSLTGSFAQAPAPQQPQQLQALVPSPLQAGALPVTQ